MCHVLLQFGGSDVIYSVFEMFQSRHTGLQTLHCHTPPHPIQNSHWASLTVLTPKHKKKNLNLHKEHDPNPDLTYMSWELQELRALLLSTTDSSRLTLHGQFAPLHGQFAPFILPFSHGKRRPLHGLILRALRTGPVLAQSKIPRWELGL